MMLLKFLGKSRFIKATGSSDKNVKKTSNAKQEANATGMENKALGINLGFCLGNCMLFLTWWEQLR